MRELAAGFGLALVLVATAQAEELSDLVARCAPDVHQVTMMAVVRHESGGNPFAIGVNGGRRLERQPKSLEEAVATAEWLRGQGIDFDAGLGQVNVRNWGWLGLGARELFDPCLNLRASARILADCYARAVRAQGEGQRALHAALSCYNTGNLTRGLRNGYVGRVAGKVGVKAPAEEAGTAAEVAVAEVVGGGDVFGARRADAFGRGGGQGRP